MICNTSLKSNKLNTNVNFYNIFKIPVRINKIICVYYLQLIKNVFNKSIIYKI